MSCEDIPSLLDLQNTKKHADDFGRLMGIGEGDSTNEVTGQVRPTYNAVMANLGYTRVGTFASGGTLLNGRQTLLWDVADGGDGQEYGWSGAFPLTGKVVPPGSNPLTTGGIAVGAWMSRFDPELRVQVREALRRSYAEAGYNLVDGSFEAGATVNTSMQVLLDDGTGVTYSWGGTLPKIVPANSTPASSGGIGAGAWTDQRNVLLRNSLPAVLYVANGVADSSGIAYASASAVSQRKVLAIMGVAHIESAITIAAKLVDTHTQMFTPTSSVTITSGYTRPEWFGGVSSEAVMAAINAIPASGGNLILLRKSYDSPFAGPFGAMYLSKPNVSILGEKIPRFADDHSQLIDGSGTIINGSFYVWANNARAENIGVDCGTVQRARLGLAKTQDGLIFAPPTHFTGETKEEGNIKNCVSLGVLANDFGHNILHEGYISGTMENLDGRCAIHNVVCKSSNVKARTIRARGAISDNLIFKSDDYGVNEDSSAEDVILTEFPGNTPTFGAIFQAATAGMSGNGLRAATIRSGATTGLRVESPAGFVNYGFIGSDITIDGSENGIYLYGNAAAVDHARLANVVVKNATVGLIEQGNAHSNAVDGVTFVNCKTHIYSESDIVVDNIVVRTNAPAASLVEYGAGSTANPTIGSVRQVGIINWDNIPAPSMLNGWAINAATGNPVFDVYSANNKINMKGILNVGSNSLAFVLDVRLRPTENIYVPLQSSPVNSSAFMVVTQDGNVYIETSGATSVSIQNVSYGKFGI